MGGTTLVYSVITLAGVLASTVLGSTSPHQEILGGEEVRGHWPEVVAIHVGPRLCTGVLTGPHTVLTAAHCLEGARSRDVWVEVTDRQGLGWVLDVSALGSHPEFCGEVTCGDETYDFGYIQLTRPVYIPRYARLLLEQDEWDQTMHEGERVHLVGFGVNVARPGGVETGEGVKREVATSLTEFSAGRLQFMAGGEGSDSCLGDSGGPAFVHTRSGLRVAGILSSGATPCGGGGWYGVAVAAASWLSDEGIYQPVADECTELECLDRGETDAAGCRIDGVGARGAPGWGLWLAIAGVIRWRRRLATAA